MQMSSSTALNFYWIFFFYVLIPKYRVKLEIQSVGLAFHSLTISLFLRNVFCKISLNPDQANQQLFYY